MNAHTTGPVAFRQAAEIVPSKRVSAASDSALQVLEKAKPKGKSELVHLTFDATHETLALPREAFDFLRDLLAQLANGHAVALVPLDAELTTQEAAEFLNVSRPFIVKLLDANEIAHRKVGTHRRVRYGELLAYKRLDDARRKGIADQLAEEAQKLGLDY